MGDSYKYIGHYIIDDLSDDEDNNRQRRTLFVQGNIILRKLMCSLGVKLTLFRTYCSPIDVYSTTLLELQKQSRITKLQIAYHNIFFNVSWNVKI